MEQQQIVESVIAAMKGVMKDTIRETLREYDMTNPETNRKKWLTTTEVCVLLRCQRSTLVKKRVLWGLEWKDGKPNKYLRSSVESSPIYRG